MGYEHQIELHTKSRSFSDKNLFFNSRRKKRSCKHFLTTPTVLFIFRCHIFISPSLKTNRYSQILDQGNNNHLKSHWEALVLVLAEHKRKEKKKVLWTDSTQEFHLASFLDFNAAQEGNSGPTRDQNKCTLNFQREQDMISPKIKAKQILKPDYMSTRCDTSFADNMLLYVHGTCCCFWQSHWLC